MTSSEEERIIGRLGTISNDQFDYLALPDDQKDVIHQRLMHLRAELESSLQAVESRGPQITGALQGGRKGHDRGEDQGDPARRRAGSLVIRPAGNVN